MLNALTEMLKKDATKADREVARIVADEADKGRGGENVFAQLNVAPGAVFQITDQQMRAMQQSPLIGQMYGSALGMQFGMTAGGTF